MEPDSHHGDPGGRLLQLDDRGECRAGDPFVWDESSQTGGRHLHDRSAVRTDRQGRGDWADIEGLVSGWRCLFW